MLGTPTGPLPRLGAHPHNRGMRSTSPFGHKMRALLKRHGLSAAEMRRELHIPSSTWSQIISGGRTPNPAQVSEWLDHVGATATERTEILELAQSVRSRGKKDIADYIKRTEARLVRCERNNNQIRSIAAGLLKTLSNNHINLTKDDQERIRLLGELIGSDE